jgi:replicative DNA helicase
MPPHDNAAEQSVLGAMMLSKDAIGEVAEILRAEDLYRPAHAALFAVILALDNAGEPVDAITVAAELDRRGELGRAGGAPYLHTLIATVPTATNASYYADIVAEKAQLRRLVEAGTRIVQLGYQSAQGAQIADIVDRAQAAIHDATTSTIRPDTGPVTGADAASVVLADLNDSHPRDLVHTGLTDLDCILGGLEPGELTVVCGRPGHGKTLLALQIARHAVLPPTEPSTSTLMPGQGKHALIFSLEMSRKLLMQRLLASTPKAGIHLNKLTKKPASELDQTDWKRLTEANAAIEAANLWIDDRSYQTTSTIRATVRRHVQRHGNLDVVVIDYLGLLTPTNRAERRDLQLAEMTWALKILADELGLPIVVVHQLNRNATQRPDKRPQLADLRDSGAVEQDAFAVIAVHTPSVDDPEDARAGESDLWILKHRQGQDGRVTAAWQAHIGRFGDLTRR